MKFVAILVAYLLVLAWAAPTFYEFGYCMNIQDGTPCHPGPPRDEEEPCAYDARQSDYVWTGSNWVRHLGLTTTVHASSAYVDAETIYITTSTTSGIAEDIAPRRPRC